MYRYRKRDGRSSTVLKAFNRCRHKLGTITRIVAHRFAATRGTGEGVFTTEFEVITIYGTNGTARFDGVCWGYGGEGPHAVKKLLQAAGVSNDAAEEHAFRSIRQRIGLANLLKMPQRRQVDWIITL